MVIWVRHVMFLFDQQVVILHPVIQLKHMTGFVYGDVIVVADQLQRVKTLIWHPNKWIGTRYLTRITIQLYQHVSLVQLVCVMRGKNLTNNRSILLSICSGFCNTLIHDAQDFSFCHWNTSSLSHFSLSFKVLDSDPFHCPLSSPVACWIASMTNLRGKPGIFTSAWRLNKQVFINTCYIQHFPVKVSKNTWPVKQWCPWVFLPIWSPCLPGNPQCPVKK